MFFGTVKSVVLTFPLWIDVGHSCISIQITTWFLRQQGLPISCNLFWLYTFGDCKNPKNVTELTILVPGMYFFGLSRYSNKVSRLQTTLKIKLTKFGMKIYKFPFHKGKNFEAFSIWKKKKRKAKNSDEPLVLVGRRIVETFNLPTLATN